MPGVLPSQVVTTWTGKDSTRSVSRLARRLWNNRGHGSKPARVMIRSNCVRRLMCYQVRLSESRFGTKRRPRGRPRKPEEIRQLIVEMAQSTGWGYGRILGELKTLRIRIAARAVTFRHRKVGQSMERGRLVAGDRLPLGKQPLDIPQKRDLFFWCWRHEAHR